MRGARLLALVGCASQVRGWAPDGQCLAVNPWLADVSHKDGEVERLTLQTFEHKVGQGSRAYIVNLFVPACPHCRALRPHMADAANRLRGHDVEVAEIDCTAEKVLCKHFNVQQVPEIWFFPASGLSPVLGYYHMDRHAEDIAYWAWESDQVGGLNRSCFGVELGMSWV